MLNKVVSVNTHVNSYNLSLSVFPNKLYKQWWVTNSDIHLSRFTYVGPDFAEAANVRATRQLKATR